MQLLKKSYEMAGEKQRHIQFYALHGWNTGTLIDIEDNGIRWKKNGYRQNGISYEMFYRTEGAKVASRLYPLSSKTTKADKVVEKKPTKTADSRHETIMNVSLNLISEKGYTTEKEIMKALNENGISKELSDRQIKRSIKDICECNNLTRKRSTKALKEQFGIVSNGYPTIIYIGD
jgi:predicted HTH transcriptional regulator